MAVNAYDSRQAFRQDAIARLGDKAVGGDRGMTAEDRKKFNDSPFMQQMKVVESATLEKLNARDRRRQQSDKSFTPKDSDFNAPKAHGYSKTVDYYGVLGLDEWASLDEIKKMYRKLSLTYHPDKLCGKTQEEKDEAAVVFIELKNAYKTLSDQPTRRQYDHDRDRDAAGSEVNGHRAKKPETTINAAELLKQLNEKNAKNKKAGSKLLKVELQCKLEKFIYGGSKSVERTRRVKDKMEYDGFREDYRLYRMDLPRGADRPHTSLFRRAGDQYLDQDADSIEFKVAPKPHPSVDVQENNLILKQELKIGLGSRTTDTFLQTEASVLRGRYVMLWGQNPFYASCSEHALLRVSMRGLGANEEGMLIMKSKIVLDHSARTATSSRRGTGHRVRRLPAGGKQFLADFGLEPPHGLRQAEGEEARDAGSFPSMQRRINKRLAEDEHLCELELVRVGQPWLLFTKPPCTVTFYMNKKEVFSQTQATPMLGICLTAPSCAPRKVEADWERLKDKVVPLLRKFGHFMVRAAVQDILPRCIENNHFMKMVSRNGPLLARTKVSSTIGSKRAGDEAFVRGDIWRALQCYSSCLLELLESDELMPKVLSNRAACFAKLGEYSASLVDAQHAAQLDPKFSRAWSRIGVAAWNVSGAQSSEALDAHTRAVELEPSDTNVRSLQSIAVQMEGPNEDESHTMKEKGNEAMRVKEYTAAVASYTIAIAKLPKALELPAGAAAENNLFSKPKEIDPHALLRAILFSNRAAAFVRLRQFDAAISDGRAAIASSATYVKARCHLGAALLGRGMYELAYEAFAKAVQLEPENLRASKARKACLTEFLLMRSLTPRLRVYNRFSLDLHRPKGSTRVFAVSDVHCDRPEMTDWIHSIDSYLFQNDVLIVAGNLANTKDSVQQGLSVLKSKFRRIFYTIGNLESWLAVNEWGKYPDSIAKINAIFEACDELGVDVYPAPVCEGLFVVPLISWYDADFDSKDPVPNGQGPDDRAKWPMDPDMQLSRYLIKLNEVHLMRPFRGTVISFSHFLPRQDLPLDPDVTGMVKTCGCTEIDEQARRTKTKLHVFGHSGQNYAQVHDGVKYVQWPVGHIKAKLKAEAAARAEDGEKKLPDIEPRLMMVHNGKEVCMQEWGHDGEPPLGFVKRIQHLAFYVVNGLTANKKRDLYNAAEKMSRIPGMKVNLSEMGSNRMNHKEFAKEIWPEILKLEPWGATFALHMVADNIEALGTCLASIQYRTDFMNTMKQFSNGAMVLDAPLGMDLTHEGKGRDDPTLIVLALRLPIPKKDAGAFEEQIEKVVASINAPAFSQGKLAAGWQKTGHQGMHAKDLAKDLSAPELLDNGGMTHVLTIYVNNPNTFKLVSGSKTFNRLRGLCTPHLRPVKFGNIDIPPELAYVIPLEFSVAAAAPKPPKIKGPRRKR